MTSEMIKLRTLLDLNDIAWVDASEEYNHYSYPYSIYRTHFEHRGYHWSVVHGFGTYGGWSSHSSDRGLLEVMSEAINGGEPIGYLTAEEVMEYVKGERNNERFH